MTQDDGGGKNYVFLRHVGYCIQGVSDPDELVQRLELRYTARKSMRQ